jgi:hypothetical protein
MTIAVPKPCCLACWELLDILGGDSNNDFGIYSHDNTVFPVDSELPSWLPVPVLRQMVIRFKERLRDALVTLLTRTPPSRLPPEASLSQHSENFDTYVTTDSRNPPLLACPMVTL